MFALADNSVVTLETMRELRDLPRGAVAELKRTDTAGAVGYRDDHTTLTWRNGKGMILRLRGKFSPDRLDELRSQIRHH